MFASTISSSTKHRDPLPRRLELHMSKRAPRLILASVFVLVACTSAFATLIGVQMTPGYPGYPFLGYDAAGTTTFTAATHLFNMTAPLVNVQLTSGGPIIPIIPGNGNTD